MAKLAAPLQLIEHEIERQNPQSSEIQQCGNKSPIQALQKTE